MEDKLLSMSLDEIIRLKRSSSSAAGSRTAKKFRKPNDGARGRIASNRRRGRVGISSANRNSRRGGVRLQVSYRNLRGLNRQRGFRGQQRGRTPRNLQDRYLQRQYNIALARNRLQMAKRFLNSRQRGRRTLGPGILQRRMSTRGLGQRIKRGRGGRMDSSALMPNTFRSNQLLRLQRINAYRNKVNRSLGSAARNQTQAAPSLIVSIENDRASTSSQVGVARGMRRGGGMGRRGNRRRLQNESVLMLQPNGYRGNALPYHTGALDPEIQRMIADIQGKSNPVGTVPIANSFPRRGGGGAAAMRGGGRVRGFGGRGGGQLARRQPVGNNIGRVNLGAPVGTRCTLNERFGGRV